MHILHITGEKKKGKLVLWRACSSDILEELGASAPLIQTNRKSPQTPKSDVVNLLRLSFCTELGEILWLERYLLL